MLGGSAVCIVHATFCSFSLKPECIQASRLFGMLKPGVYTLREVVTEADVHTMAAFSNEVSIPKFSPAHLCPSFP